MMFVSHRGTIIFSVRNKNMRLEIEIFDLLEGVGFEYSIDLLVFTVFRFAF